MLLIIANAPKPDLNANLAKLYIKGAILESESFAKQIENLKASPNIRGVLLVIDSPGGALGASVEIADMVKELNNTIPVVAYVQGTMASGSYYAGMYANTIVANRGSMIGSIGVILNGYNIKELMNKIGIQPQTLYAGEYKEAGSFSKEWSKNEKEYLQNVINQHYNMFIDDVSNARGLDRNNYKAFADGKIFNAYDAQRLNLIDLVASQGKAIGILQELSGVQKPIWAKQNSFDTFLEKVASKASSQIISYLSAKLQ